MPVRVGRGGCIWVEPAGHGGVGGPSDRAGEVEKGDAQASGLAQSVDEDGGAVAEMGSTGREEQDTLGNKCSTAGEEIGMIWRGLDLKSSSSHRVNRKREIIRHWQELCFDLSRGTRKFWWNSEEGPQRWHLAPGPRAWISAQLLLRSLAVHPCRSQCQNPPGMPGSFIVS